MNLHIAQIGTGRVGRPTAYTILCAGIADTITVCDTKPGLAPAFAEDLKHAAASLKIDIEINSCEKDEDVCGADAILISAGKPRVPGLKMSRRDLAVQNGQIIRTISNSMTSRNAGAKYIVITNPVDAMAMICKKYTKAEFVISTGTNLESLRFRSKLAEVLDVNQDQISGWVGGEHGDAAQVLWSTTRISGQQVDNYAVSNNKILQRDQIETYLKKVSKFIVDNVGGTEFGPAASFRDITSAIANDTKEVLSIAAPLCFENIPEPVFVGVPTQVGKSLGASIYDKLDLQEQIGLQRAAEVIFETYKTATEAL